MGSLTNTDPHSWSMDKRVDQIIRLVPKYKMEMRDALLRALDKSSGCECAVARANVTNWHPPHGVRWAGPDMPYKTYDLRRLLRADHTDDQVVGFFGIVGAYNAQTAAIHRREVMRERYGVPQMSAAEIHMRLELASTIARSKTTHGSK